MARHVLPDPSLVVLVGAAGAGKTTFAALHFRPDEVLSSDAMRGRISGDEADQGATAAAFALLHRLLEARLARGLLTVVDATNVTRAARHALLRRAAAREMPAVAIVLRLDEALVLGRNAGRRGRVVPERAVRGHVAALARVAGSGRPAGSDRGRGDDDDAALVAGLRGEGFRDVMVLRTPEAVDAFELVRVAGGSDGAGSRPGAAADPGRVRA